MKIKVFTLHFDPELGGFDDRALSAFVADKTVLAVDQHFFVHEQRPLWSLLVSYREAVAQPSDRRGQPARDERVDWRSSLPAEARPYFDLLRSWRNARAQRTGKPPYVLLTNRQLALLARQRPTTLAALGELEGVGEARVSELGAEILAVFASAGQVEAGSGS